MQRHFCDAEGRAYVPGANTLIKQIKKLIEVFAEHRRPIIFTRHIDEEGSLLARWWQDTIKEDEPMSEIIDELDVKQGMILVKHQYDAFLNTDLEKILKEKGVGQVVICGVLTNFCCETTARSAFMRGFEVYFSTDGTRTYSKKMHEATSLNLSYGFAMLLTVTDVLSSLGQ
jgi:nicotinamidase-related amidase